VRKLRQHRRLRTTEEDSQPGMLAMISLLLLLLPFLLLTTSPQKLAALGFQLPAAGEGLPALPPGVVEDLLVRVESDALILQQDLRNTDVLASVGDVERQELRLLNKETDFDIQGLQTALRKVKSIDPSRDRVTLAPASQSTAAEVIRLMDALRKDQTGPLFQEVVLGATK
jgi:biopolymer transport protein ExbD